MAVLLALLLAVPASARPIPAKARKVMRWVRACMDDNPFAKGGPLQNAADARGRGEAWAVACFEQSNPCDTDIFFTQKEEDSVPRCIMCVEDAPEPGRPVGGMCVQPPAYTLAKPRGDGGGGGSPKVRVISDSEACIKYYLKSYVWEKVRSALADGRKAEELPPNQIVCETWDHLVFLRRHTGLAAKEYLKRGKKCSTTALRDAEHYTWNWCAVRTDGVIGAFPNLWCSITAGYTGVKSIGFVRDLLATDGEKASPPSWEEIYWGCQGIWHGQDGELPYMTKEEYGSPP